MQQVKRVLLTVACVALALATVAVASAATPTAAAPAAAKTFAIAGHVEADPAVIPFIFLHIVDGRSGAVIRSAALDGTGAFTVAGLPATVTEVRASAAALPADQFSLDEAQSVLTAAIDPASGVLRLKVAATRVASATPAAAAVADASVDAVSVVPGLVTLAVLAVAWSARHTIVKALDFPAWKAPKQRKMMVAR